MLSLGQSATAIIQAQQKWNDTGIRLEAGQEYQFAAVGQWVDWWIPCGADGYPSINLVLRLTEWLRRAPQENWFALIGSLDSDEHHLFTLGTTRIFQAITSGVLTCFANDVAFMYWNNRGSVQLTVTRTR